MMKYYYSKVCINKMKPFLIDQSVRVLLHSTIFLNSMLFCTRDYSFGLITLLIFRASFASYYVATFRLYDKCYCCVNKIKNVLKGQLQCFSMQVVMKKCFFLPRKKFGIDPSYRFRKKNRTL